MITFIFEPVWWIKARKFRDEYANKPYFWGAPDSREGYYRHNVFMMASGIAPLGYYDTKEPRADND